jgi:alanyl-tRNA synthetase
VQSSQSELSTQAVKIEGLNVLAVQLDDVDGKGMRDVLDQLKNKLGSAAIILAVVNGGKVSLIAGVSKDQTGRIKAGDLVNFVAAQVGGKGGGRPEMAQAGGNDPAGLEKALADVPEWIRSQISS